MEKILNYIFPQCLGQLTHWSRKPESLPVHWRSTTFQAQQLHSLLWKRPELLNQVLSRHVETAHDMFNICITWSHCHTYMYLGVCVCACTYIIHSMEQSMQKMLSECSMVKSNPYTCLHNTCIYIYMYIYIPHIIDIFIYIIYTRTITNLCVWPNGRWHTTCVVWRHAHPWCRLWKTFGMLLFQAFSSSFLGYLVGGHVQVGKKNGNDTRHHETEVSNFSTLCFL